MKFDRLLEIVGDEPVFETGLLLAGDVSVPDVQRQLSRWVRDGRLYSLRRGLYSLAPPYQKVAPHPFLIANRLVRGSYVSLQSALAHHGLIPENVPVVTSVSAQRPGRFTTPLGTFDFRHLQPGLIQGFTLEPVATAQEARIATASKALADLIYLEPNADDIAYLKELRLDGLAEIDRSELRQHLSSRPKLLRALRHLEALAREEGAFQPL